MADQKKDKPKVNVRDLKPNKDAKGGGSGHRVQGSDHRIQGSGHQVQGSGHQLR